MDIDYQLRPIGFIRSTIENREQAPKQGTEGAPDATLELDPAYAEGLLGLEPGAKVVLVTWFHLSRRDVLQVHPRNNRNAALRGVFLTRSPDRPNPLGLHEVTVRSFEGNTLIVGPLEALDGTPVVDMKVALRKTPRESQ
ncbi:MAG: tRNA (N6-threonylcarbamoyladenosine(37)-N6)-methyltransferase TrmO [Desulfovibrionaceae bacterium]